MVSVDLPCVLPRAQKQEWGQEPGARYQELQDSRTDALVPTP